MAAVRARYSTAALTTILTLAVESWLRVECVLQVFTFSQSQELDSLPLEYRRPCRRPLLMIIRRKMLPFKILRVYTGHHFEKVDLPTIILENSNRFEVQNHSGPLYYRNIMCTRLCTHANFGAALTLPVRLAKPANLQ